MNYCRKSAIYFLILVFAISLSVTNLSAKGKFEGYWITKTYQKSNLPGQPKEQTTDQKVYYKDGKMKMVDQKKNEITIIRLDKEVSWTISPDSKRYREMKFSDVEQGMKQMQEAMSEGMKDLSPEERQQMQKMMGERFSKMFNQQTPTVSFESTGKKKKIQGYDCHQVILSVNSEPMMEMWLTDKYDLGDDFVEMYKKMGLIKGELPENIDEVRGFPIYSKTEISAGPMGTIETETTVEKIVPTSVSDSEFEVPKGYKKVETEMPFKR